MGTDGRLAFAEVWTGPDNSSMRVNFPMDKKEINSPKLTANFLFWVCGVGGVLLLAILAHYVWRVF
jgi:hypothetical protein